MVKNTDRRTVENWKGQGQDKQEQSRRQRKKLKERNTENGSVRYGKKTD